MNSNSVSLHASHIVSFFFFCRVKGGQMQRRLRVELLKLIHIPYILLVIDKEETSIPYIYNARMEVMH